jgi:hypothetical protein
MTCINILFLTWVPYENKPNTNFRRRLKYLMVNLSNNSALSSLICRVWSSIILHKSHAPPPNTWKPCDYHSSQHFITNQIQLNLMKGLGQFNPSLQIFNKSIKQKTMIIHSLDNSKIKAGAWCKAY